MYHFSFSCNCNVIVMFWTLTQRCDGREGRNVPRGC